MATVKNKIELKDNMTPVLSKMLTAMNSVVKAMQNTDNASSKAFKQAEKDIQRASNELSRFNNTSTSTPSLLDLIQKSATGAAGAIYTLEKAFAAVGKVAQASDDLTLMNARLGLITDDVGGLEDKIYNLAQSSRGNFKSIASTVSSLGMQAGEAFNNSEDEILAFTDTLNKMFTVSGLDSSGISSVMYNLTQSLSSGALLGQDYRILKQNAPKFREALQQYYGVSASELQDMVSAGKVSAQDVKLAMFQAAGEINEQFNKIPKTFSQSMDALKNTVNSYMIPINEKINNILNSSAVQSFLTTIDTSIKIALTAIDVVLGAIQSLINAMSPIKELLDYIGVALGITLVGALAVLLAMAVKTFVMIAAKILLANLPLLGIIAAITAVIFILNKLGVSAKQIIEGLVGAFYVAGAAIYNLGTDIYNFFIGILKVITGIINALFGTSIGASLEFAERKSYSEAWGNGKEMGDKIYGKVNEMSSNLSNMMSGNGINVSNVDGTVNTKGEMSITEEDLKLLKDVSATEFINRFTTLRPTLNASFGDVHETADVNGILERVGDMMEQAIAESLY